MKKFDALLAQAQEDYAGADQELNALKKELELRIESIKEVNKAKGQVVQRLKRIQEMVSWEEKPYQWNLSSDGPSQSQCTAWKERSRFRTTELDFYVVITEVTNLKRDKWEVHATATRQTMGERDAYSGYNNYDYGKDKYMKYYYDHASGKRSYLSDPEKGNLVMAKKFASEAEARQFAKEWMKRLADDHTEEVASEVELFKGLKSPKVKAPTARKTRETKKSITSVQKSKRVAK